MMTNKVIKTDINDIDIIDAEELSSDGYLSYRSINLISTTSATRLVVISGSDLFDTLNHNDYPVESGDKIEIYDNDAIGRYTIEEIVDSITFRVIENINDSTDGYANFIHPSGASKVGLDSGQLEFTNADNVQEAFEDLNNHILPKPTQIGQFLYSVESDNLTFTVEKPMVNDDGLIIVNEDDNIVVI